MRHRYNNLTQMNTWAQKASLVIRNLLTSLVTYWEISTTAKRAKILKAEADSFFARLVGMWEQYDNEKDVRREAIRFVKSVIFTEDAGKKIVDNILPKYKKEGRKTWFVRDFKLWPRPWDNTEKVLLKLI